MSTIATPRAQWHVDRRFYTGVAAAMLVVTFIGFAPTYYLAGLTSAPPLDLVVHFHGVVYSAWILFFLVQNGLIAARREGCCYPTSSSPHWSFTTSSGRGASTQSRSGRGVHTWCHNRFAWLSARPQPGRHWHARSSAEPGMRGKNKKPAGATQG